MERRAAARSPQLEEKVAELQQQLAVALARFIEASRATQREIVVVRGTASNERRLWEKLVVKTHEENEAFDRYVEVRRSLIRLLQPKPKATA